MQTNVIFNIKKEETIQKEIINLLKKAESSISLAVAWLTDEDILRVLAQRAEAGVVVRIVICNSKENFKNTYKFKDFLKFHGKLFVTTEPFMHHKFCIIDNIIVINGSYNWSYTARTNEENILVLVSQNSTEDLQLLKKFNVKYNFLLDRCSVPIVGIETLNDFKDNAPSMATLISGMDEFEIQKRKEFENAVHLSIEQARNAGIKLNFSGLIERMQRDGGGVNFVKRLLHDEIQTHEMKSGFRKLEEQDPPRIELSLEYLVANPIFQDLFTPEEVGFCINLMKQYNIQYN
jgi:hypothetical protein